MRIETESIKYFSSRDLSAFITDLAPDPGSPSLLLPKVDSPSSHNAPLFSVEESALSLLPGRILESIPEEGCTLLELEAFLDTNYGAYYSSDVIRQEAFALSNYIEVILEGPEDQEILLRHTSRSRSAIENPALTLDARSTIDPYEGRAFTLDFRHLWLVAGGAAHRLNPQKCAVMHQNEDGTLKIGACPDDHKHEKRVSRLWCYDPACPTCYGAYAHRAGRDAVERLIGGYLAWKKEGVDLGPIKAWVISPIQEEAIEKISTPVGYRSQRQELYNFMEKYGIKADYPIFHPWRVNTWVKRVYQKEMDKRRKIAKEKKERGEELKSKDKTIPLWQWIHEEDLLTPDKDAIYFAPHWHVFGFGFVEEDSRQIEKDTGWILKLLDVSWQVFDDGSVVGWDRKKKVAKTREDLERAVKYPFTHIGVMYDSEKMYDEEGRFTDKRTWTPIQATVPHGMISSQKLSKQVTFEDETVYCPVCQKQLVAYTLHKDEGMILNEDGLWVPDWDLAIPSPVPWVETVSVVTFYVRGRGPPDPGGPIGDHAIGTSSFGG